MSVYPESRYAGAKVTRVRLPNGDIRPYIHDRIITKSSEVRYPVSSIILEVGVELDSISARVYGDEQFYWRVADANDIMFPFEDSNIIGQNALYVGRILIIPR